MAHTLDELPVYAAAVKFCSAVNAILQRSAVCRDFDVHGQISSANDSITANMKEGFEQSTDKSFANFLTHSKASLAEVLERLSQAEQKQYLTKHELQVFRTEGDTLARMLGGFIKYLDRSDFKKRGRFRR